MRVVHIVPASATIAFRKSVENLVSRQRSQDLDAEWITWSEPATDEIRATLRRAEILHLHAASLSEASFDRPRGFPRLGLAGFRRTRVLSIHGPSPSRPDRGRADNDDAASRRLLARFASITVARPSLLEPTLAPRKGKVGIIANPDDFAALYSNLRGVSRRRILETTIDVSTRQVVITTIQTALDTREKLRITFVNANLAIEAVRDASVSAALADFTLLNDGIGIDLASIVLYGRPFPENLNGTDFIPTLLDALRPGSRLYLLGGSAEVIAAASVFYAARWPQHHVAGYHHGFFDGSESGGIADRIRDANCDIVLVAMGSPRQERWIADHIPDVAPVGLGVGALFDFQTGRVPRAPVLVRRLRLEWLWRLALEPRRLWRRYLVGGSAFALRIARQWLRGDRG